jgi:5-methylcytosine-specific restriction endonuclease McrA
MSLTARRRAAQTRRRKVQHPLCKFCLERGIVTAANVVDHVVPHKGDWTAFVTGKLQSLCEHCHNFSTAAEQFIPEAAEETALTSHTGAVHVYHRRS